MIRRAPRERARLVLCCAVLAAALLAAYGSVGSFGYIGYDDGEYVVQNASLGAGGALDRVRWAFTTFHAANWHPVTWLSLVADHAASGSDPAWHHREALALHAASAVLLLLLVARVTGSAAAGLVVALLFALHPLRVETVAWASERKGVLAGAFSLAALLTHVESCRRPGSRLAWATWAFGAAAMLSKPSAVALPLLMLLLDWWPLGKVGRGGAGLSAAVREQGPLVAVAVLTMVLTVAAQHHGGTVMALDTLSLAQRASAAAVSPWILFGKTLWPAGLAPVYPLQVPAAGAAVAATAGLALTSAASVRLRTSRPWFAFAWFGWLLMLAPVSNLAQVGSQLTADRYSWLPHVPLLLGAVVGSCRALPRRRAPRAAALLGALCLAGALGLAARLQTALWGDEIALFSHAVAVTRGNWKMEYALARALSARGREDEAIRHYELALAARPGYPAALNNLGTLYGRRGNAAAAEALFANALAADPGHVSAWHNLGHHRALAGDFAGALACYDRVVSLDPGSADGWSKRGLALVRLGRAGEALASCREALRRDADSAEARDCVAAAGAGR